MTDEDFTIARTQKCGSAGSGLIFPQPSKEREKRRAERGWRCCSKAAAAAKADWIQIVEGMIQIWSRDSAPVAYWETRDCMVVLTKCGRNGCDALSSDRGSREGKPSRAKTVFKVSVRNR